MVWNFKLKEVDVVVEDFFWHIIYFLFSYARCSAIFTFPFFAIIFDILTRFTMSKFWCLYGLCPLKSSRSFIIQASSAQVTLPPSMFSQPQVKDGSLWSASSPKIFKHIGRNQTNTNDNIWLMDTKIKIYLEKKRIGQKSGFLDFFQPVFFFLCIFCCQVFGISPDLETKLLCYLTPPFHQCSGLDEFSLPKYAHSHWMTEPTF